MEYIYRNTRAPGATEAVDSTKAFLQVYNQCGVIIRSDIDPTISQPIGTLEDVSIAAWLLGLQIHAQSLNDRGNFSIKNRGKNC